MKHLVPLLVILATLLPSAEAFNPRQKTFEGVITYKISYPDNKKLTESQKALFPKMLVVTVKGEKAKAEIVMAMGNQVDITDYTSRTKTSLFDIMGQKYAVKYSYPEIQQQLKNEPPVSVTHSLESKMIAGYLCKKAIVTVNDKKGKYNLEVYYSPDLGPKDANFSSPLFRDIEGVLMEFTMRQEGYSMRFTATSVEKKTVSPREFEIPSDYTITTEEELQNKFNGTGH